MSLDTQLMNAAFKARRYGDLPRLHLADGKEYERRRETLAGQEKRNRTLQRPQQQVIKQKGKENNEITNNNHPFGLVFVLMFLCEYREKEDSRVGDSKQVLSLR